MAAALLVSGLGAAPAVELNGKPLSPAPAAAQFDGKPAFAIPLAAQ